METMMHDPRLDHVPGRIADYARRHGPRPTRITKTRRPFVVVPGRPESAVRTTGWVVEFGTAPRMSVRLGITRPMDLRRDRKTGAERWTFGRSGWSVVESMTGKAVVRLDPDYLSAGPILRRLAEECGMIRPLGTMDARAKDWAEIIADPRPLVAQWGRVRSPFGDDDGGPRWMPHLDDPEPDGPTFLDAIAGKVADYLQARPGWVDDVRAAVLRDGGAA